MWGEFENPKRDLFSGLFIRVRMGIPLDPAEANKWHFVSEAALGSDQGRKYLYVVKEETKDDGKTHQVVDRIDVEVGQRQNGLIAVKGLQGDERVVVSNLQRIRPKTEVAVPEYAGAHAPSDDAGDDGARQGRSRVQSRPGRSSLASSWLASHPATVWGTAVFSRFFIDRPIFASVMSIVITLAGLVAIPNLPVAQYPQITPPSIIVSVQLPRRRRQGRRRVGRRAHRAASQRRRRHDLHVVAVGQRRLVLAFRHVQAGRQPQFRPGAGPEPRQPRPAAAARRRQAGRRHHAQTQPRHSAHRQRLFAEPHATTNSI